MSDSQGISSFPLHWPVGWPRTKHPQTASFGVRGAGVSVANANEALRHELRLLGAQSVVVSTDLPLRQDGQPRGDRDVMGGAAVYFRIKGQPRVLACDKWDRVSDNLQALAKHVGAIRGQLRWGVGSIEQAFGGYKALPEVGARRPWHEVLGVPPTSSLQVVRDRQRELLAQHHPDRGGSTDRAGEINAAVDEYRRLFGGGGAGASP